MSGDRESIRERLLKVLRLAQEGVGGEKVNAEALLAKLLKKHRISREELEESVAEPTEEVWLKYSDDYEFAVLRQLVKRICGRKRKVFTDKRKRRQVVVSVTHPEKVALTIAWEVYRKAWKSAMESLVIAFVYKHDLRDLSADLDDDSDQPELTPEEKEKARRAAMMMEGLAYVPPPAKRLSAGVPVPVAENRV